MANELRIRWFVVGRLPGWLSSSLMWLVATAMWLLVTAAAAQPAPTQPPATQPPPTQPPSTKAPPTKAPPRAAAKVAPQRNADQLSDTERAEAKRLFRAGSRAYSTGRFGVAAKLFDQAYLILPNAAFRFSAAQALRRQHAMTPSRALLQKALRYYRQYIKDVKHGRRVADAAEGANAVEVLLSRMPDAGSEGAAPEEPADATATGTLQVDSLQPGAVARIDNGEPITEFPHWDDLKPGMYTVSVTADGYITRTRKVRIEIGRVSAVDGNLDEQPARLTVNAGSGDDILVDGRVVGEGQVGPLALPSGRHRIVVAAEGRKVTARDVMLTRNQDETIDVELSHTAQRVIAWVFLATASATVVAAGVFTGLAAKRGADARDITDAATNEMRTLSIEQRDQFNGHLEARDEMATVAATAYVGGALIAGVGLLLFELDAPDLFEAAAQRGKATDSAPATNPTSDMPGDIEATLAPSLAPSFAPGSAFPSGGVLSIHGRF